jgi:uncharacterized repeat protein (TIGR01451 family)
MKLVDNVITLEGMFTVVLFTDVSKTKEGKIQYSFVTQNSGNTTAKAPMGMFEEDKIPNDLTFVKKSMVEFYG